MVDDTQDASAVRSMQASAKMHGAKFVHLNRRLSIGEKRNIAGEILSDNDVIAHWYEVCPCDSSPCNILLLQG